MVKTRSIRSAVLLCFALFPIPLAPADGGYFSRGSIAISADQRAIIIRNGTNISMTLSTGYTGDGEDFCWIIPTPMPPAIKDVIEAGQNGENAFTALDQLTAPTFVNEPRPSSCFPAGTAVLTAHGPRTIETIDDSARVWACDLTTGNWALARVLRRISSRYDGDVVTLAAGEIAIRVTGNHPFRVLRGDRLDERPRPRDVPEEELSTGKHGRWVEARDLKVGDVLAARNGEGLVVSELASRQERLEVFNLEVEGYHTYAVSQRGVLVHNKGKMEVEDDTAPPLMTVYGRVILEHYEVSILGAAAASPLLEWLRHNGYRVNPAAEKALDAYIGRGWAFVAIKLNPAEKRRYESEFLPPLTLRYRSERLIFPLQISSVSTVSTVKISLYVIAESAISSATHRTVPLVYERSLFASDDPEEYIEARIRETAGREGRALVVMWRGGENTGSRTIIRVASTSSWRPPSRRIRNRISRASRPGWTSLP